ncbi:MAG: lipid-A-disaccharide synthase [Verrucomicrobiota bacterium]|nr:lipid-A-disaccharide synthase [Verrucomicrobiota bacterium]
MTLYFVAGEASGDEHGAALMRALRELQPDLGFIGRGGPRMKAIAGEHFINWSDAAAIVGLWEVVKHYGYFRAQFRATLQEVAENQPDAVVLIDYPGFNLRLARALRGRSTALKIIYYISPQVWAWNRGRIRAMARSLNLMLCIFPFEAELYNQSGLRTIFVGHPMIENLGARRIDAPRDPNLIGLFPGSRLREVRKIFPIMLAAAHEIAQRQPGVRFAVAAASERLIAEIEQLLKRDDFPPDKIRIVAGETSLVMQQASVGIIASGSATLEAAYFRLPFVLAYKVAWLTYFAARVVVRVKYLGMPNVLANRQIVPEFIQHRARPGAVANAVLKLMIDPAARELMISEFNAIISKLGEGDADQEAAQAILEEIGENKS